MSVSLTIQRVRHDIFLKNISQNLIVILHFVAKGTTRVKHVLTTLVRFLRRLLYLNQTNLYPSFIEAITPTEKETRRNDVSGCGTIRKGQNGGEKNEKPS